MGRRERIVAAINREPVDRVPYAVWRHFPSVDRSAAGLAQTTLRFHERYGSDFLKITPRGGYAVEAWGCVEGDELREDGHRPCVSCAIRAPEDWKKIRPLDPGSAPGWVEHLETIVRMGFDRRIGDSPVLPTLFSPLSLARKLSGTRLTHDLHEHPTLVTGALEVITETVIRFAALALAEGRAKTVGAVVGGLDQWKTLRDGTPEQARAEAQDAIAQTRGIGLIVGPGCVLPLDTPDANVAAVVQALGGPLKKIPGVAT